MYRVILFLGVVVAAAHAYGAYKDPNTAEGRSAMVHLFEWNWKAIANECEDFLAPHGFGGVQVSPPHEHRVIFEPSWDPSVKRPWYESYQPISYQLESRRGSRQDFIDMVQRCNAVGVRIYVDAVVNHMCGEDAGPGTGSGGSPYDTTSFSFPGVGYTSSNFNQPLGICTTGDGMINDYNDANIVRNCNLVGLLDLDTSQEYVQQKIVDYFNDVIQIGVAGFRIDAAKHMWPDHLASIFDKTNDLNTDFFPAGSRPFFYQEVIDQNTGEAVKAEDYSPFARVTDFIYGKEVSEAFRDGGSQQIGNFENFGQWGVKLSDEDGLVFIDNHDNQRGHGGGGFLVTHKYPRYYQLAIAYMLSWPHGFPRIMSSYDFDVDWTGPPHNVNDWSILDPTFNSDGTCAGDWICEHRWRPIKNMVEWRNQAGSEPVQNWWSNYQRAAFSRGNKAFIAINRDWTPIDEVLQTGLPAGEYCNLAVVDYNKAAQSCTGDSTVTVNSDGTAHIYVDNNGVDTLLLIHVGATKNGPIVAPTSNPDDPTPYPGDLTPYPGDLTPYPGDPTPQEPQPSAPTGTERTVIFIRKYTVNGEDMFIRGGIDHSRREGCNNDAETSQCAIPITHRIGGNNAKFNAWSQGDNYLDWYGMENDQGKYDNWQSAEGTPLVWTTNQANYHATVEADGYGYTPLNQWGEHYWMIDVNMDCGKTEEGWFELKGLLNGGRWETDRNQVPNCGGSAGGSAPYLSSNHFARCGYVNMFTFDGNDCQIDFL